MDGCTLQTTGLQKGAFIELVLKPTVEDETIRIQKAMVCSVRPSSIGIRFLDVQLEHHRRLAQVILGLLVGQGLDPEAQSYRSTPLRSGLDFTSRLSIKRTGPSRIAPKSTARA